uniref:Uncharacterized protein n=1 Tax=Arundo donax TaxID=35708 RepID=A0A0A9GI47_ARUDO
MLLSFSSTKSKTLRLQGCLHSSNFS